MKYLILFLLLVSCSYIPDKSLDNSISGLTFSVDALTCQVNIKDSELLRAAKVYNLKTKNQVLFYLDHLILECLEKKYEETK